jgi:hypothetical protein
MSNDMQIPEAWFDLPPGVPEPWSLPSPSVSSGMYVHSKDCRLTTGTTTRVLQGFVHWMGHEPPLAVEGGNAWQPPASSGEAPSTLIGSGSHEEQLLSERGSPSG